MLCWMTTGVVGDLMPSFGPVAGGTRVRLVLNVNPTGGPYSVDFFSITTLDTYTVLANVTG